MADRFLPNIGYWSGKLLTDSLKDIKSYRNTSKYVERKSDQIMRPSSRPRPKGRYGTNKRKPLLDPRRVKRKASTKRKRTTTKKKGSFKKAKKIRKTPSKFAKRHYDDYASVERDYCAYIGFQSHGSKDRMWSIIGEALTKALLAKIKIYPRAYDEVLDFVTNFDALYLTFKRVSVPGGVDATANSNIAFTVSTTFEQLAIQVSDAIKAYAERTNDADGNYAFYPVEAMWYNGANDDHNRVKVSDLGESVIELYANQVITVKNLTPNDDGLSALDVVGVNPIHGKKYEFNNFRPKVIDTVLDTHYDVGAFHEVNDADGINFCQLRNTSGTAVTMGEDHVLSHPPVPRQLFTNCKRAALVSMPAGGSKTERTAFKMKHKLSTLIERIYYNQFDKGSFGGCTFFGFERKTRTVNGDSRVKISFDRALHMSAHCKLAVKKTMLKHYEGQKIIDTAIRPTADPA